MNENERSLLLETVVISREEYADLIRYQTTFDIVETLIRTTKSYDLADVLRQVLEMEPVNDD